MCNLIPCPFFILLSPHVHLLMHTLIVPLVSHTLRTFRFWALEQSVFSGSHLCYDRRWKKVFFNWILRGFQLNLICFSIANITNPCKIRDAIHWKSNEKVERRKQYCPKKLFRNYLRNLSSKILRKVSYPLASAVVVLMHTLIISFVRTHPRSKTVFPLPLPSEDISFLPFRTIRFFEHGMSHLFWKL